MHNKLVAPLVALAGVFVAAGGYIHLREWLDTYRDVPASVPGSEVVTIGFPVNVATSIVAVIALAVALLWKTEWLRLVVTGVAVFQAASLAVLVQTRNGSFLGWTEPTWTPGAEQTLAVEIGALVALAAVVAMDTVLRRGDDPYPAAA